MREEPKPKKERKREPAPVPQTPNQMFRAWVAGSARSVNDIAADMGMDRKQIHELTQGKTAISHSTAHRLHRVTGISWEVWLR